MADRRLQMWGGVVFLATTALIVAERFDSSERRSPAFFGGGYIVSTYLYGKAKGQTDWLCVLACFLLPLGPILIWLLPDRTGATAPAAEPQPPPPPPSSPTP